MLFENQQYQLDCVNNIITALKGVDFDNGGNARRLAANIEQIGKENGLGQFPVDGDKKQLDVLMETGTGKTFTYLKTIFELHKQFNQTKFIIVLPRTAIKQGVIQNIKLTDEYFFNEYGKHINYIDYPKDGLGTINQNFINSTDLSVLITTNSAFNSNKNNINKKTESLFKFGDTWTGIASKKPVVIIDEPHLLKGSETQKGLEKLDKSLFIRFGATYPREDAHKISNVVYALDSISAFNQYLVKQIGVSTVFINSEESSLHIRNLKPKTNFEAFYNLNEQLHKTTVYIKDDIGAKINLDKYRGISVVKINRDKIYLSDGTTLEQSKGNYRLSDSEVEMMVKHAIRLHFEKEQRLFEKNIKALSLFFISSINSFRGENPIIKKVFEQQYKIIRAEVYKNTKNKAYKAYLDKDYKDGQLQVHDGYFSGDRGSNDEKERQGVDLILNDKERLLSTDTPLRFIFSVWALQEGWDNPNIFTICKLSSTDQDTSRRQQVGRGLRIAVNQQGKRLTHQHLGEREHDFYDINALDMVVSAQEQDFIHGIQNEIMEASFSVVGDAITGQILKDCGLNERECTRLMIALEDNEIIKFNEDSNEYTIQSPILDYLVSHRAVFAFVNDQRFEEIKRIFTTNSKQHVIDKNKPFETVKVRQKQWQEFKTLWETINKNSAIVYKNIKEEGLIESISATFSNADIQPNRAHIYQQTLDTQQNQINSIEDSDIDGSKSNGYFNRHSRTQFITKFAKDERLPISFIAKLFNKLNWQSFENNPQDAQDQLRHLIKEKIHSSIIKSVGYEFNQTSIYPNELQDERGESIEELKYTLLGRYLADENPGKEEFLYDKVVYDSKIEKSSIQDDPIQTNGNAITVFAKLPKINIPTPYKTYNPDFAYLIKRANGKQLFLVVETKGYKYEDNISKQEKQKIDYAKVFFHALQKEMPNVNIQYKTRTTQQSLATIIREAADDT